MKSQDSNFVHKTISGFTLADVARETSLHDHSVWGVQIKLRNKPVQFVSSGLSEPLKSDSTDEAGINIVNTMATHHEKQQELHTEESDRPHSLPALRNESGSLNSPTPSLQMRVTESALDQASYATEVFFIDTIGEKMTGKSPQVLPVKVPERHSSPDCSSGDEVILFRGRKSYNDNNPITSVSHKTSLPTVASAHSHHSADDLCSPLIGSKPTTSMDNFSRRRKEERGRDSIGEEQDILLDYISNMRENGELGDVYEQGRNVRLDLGGSDDELFYGSDPSDDETYGGSYVGDRDSLQRPNKNSSASDRSQMYHQKVDNNEDIDSSYNEQHALLTFAAESMSGSSSALNKDSSGDPSAWNTQRTRENLSREQADFDFMDWDRPSIQPVRRSKKVQAPHLSFDNCDSDLEYQLKVARKNDRLRKKERKQQREELHGLGLLRKKTTPDDLRVKYPLGMTITDVADELRFFLREENEFLTFPPMDLHARKVIHELANKFNVKSKSIGQADQRRPALYRTIRTLSYSEAAFDQAIGRIQRRFLPRLDMKGKGKPNNKTQKNSAASKTAASYQEGEIVGAAAPELGVENRGRAMLEKMGWSCGTALGAADNKGILQPVSLAMRRSRAGLG
ncbi:hypothetical protein EsDP_00000322 [Epichloe bromicola]|uniref:Protein SQS1 n=1 Tax=Epichloe bromicola TaxID=79588 RepID=A0ABQ0CEK2_9HYPO